MKAHHFILYCFPRSDTAQKLGCYKTGGHYVAESMRRGNGTYTPSHIAPGCENKYFARADDPGLLALLAKCKRNSAKE